MKGISIVTIYIKPRVIESLEICYYMISSWLPSSLQKKKLYLETLLKQRESHRELKTNKEVGELINKDWIIDKSLYISKCTLDW